MTRTEFIDGIHDFYDLKDFCNDEGLDYCDDVYDKDEFAELMMDRIRQMDDWEEIKGLVEEIPTGYEFYRTDNYGGFEDADYYFDTYKDDVLRWMDDCGEWDDEEEVKEEKEECVVQAVDWACCAEDIDGAEDIAEDEFLMILERT